MSLFYSDNQAYFDMARLENAAYEMLTNCSLVMRSRDGDRAAAIALSRGFWPFTRDFEKAIDRRANSTNLPRQPLYLKFGRNKTRESLVGSAQSIKNLLDSEIVGVFEEARTNLVEMQKDEFRHSKHWEADARNLGVSFNVLQSVPALPLVQQLIDATSSGDLVEFFAGALASTEFVAEALGALFGSVSCLHEPVRAAPGDLDGGSYRAPRRRAFARGDRDGLRQGIRRVGLVEAYRGTGPSGNRPVRQGGPRGGGLLRTRHGGCSRITLIQDAAGASCRPRPAKCLRVRAAST